MKKILTGFSLIIFFLTGYHSAKAMKVTIRQSPIVSTQCENNNRELTFYGTATSTFNKDLTSCVIWMWGVKKDGVIINAGTSDGRTFKVTLNESGNYTIDAYASGAPCGPFSKNGYSNKLDVYVGFDVRPSPITGNDFFCANAQSSSYSVPGVLGATHYRWTVPQNWKVNGQLGPHVTTTSRTVTISQVNNGNTTEYITVRAVNSCGLSRGTSKPVYMRSYPAPYIDGDTYLCSGGSSSYLFATSSDGTNYNWNVSGPLQISYTNNYSVSVRTTSSYGSTPGSISVSYTDPCGARVSATKSVTIYSCSSQYSVSPNPSDGMFAVERIGSEQSLENDSQSKDFEVILFDDKSKPVLSGKSKNHKFTADTRKLKKGTYYLHIITEDNIQKTIHIVN